MPKILSFDVGMKNLSYCIINHDLSPCGYGIEEWDTVSIDPGNSVSETCENLVNVLDSLPFLEDVSIVIIENQPVTKNPKMKTIQIVILSYFLCKKQLPGSTIGKVLLLNSSLKLKAYNGPPQIPTTKSKNPYLIRKNLVILYTKYELRDDAASLELFLSHKKKDDLSDSFLQALYVLRKMDHGLVPIGGSA